MQDREGGWWKISQVILVLPKEASQAVLGVPGGSPGSYQLPAGSPVQAPGAAPLAVAAVIMTQLPLQGAVLAGMLMLRCAPPAGLPSHAAALVMGCPVTAASGMPQLIFAVALCSAMRGCCEPGC